MSVIDECQNKLIAKAQEVGYLIFDDILDISDTYNLSLAEVDKLSEKLQIRGIIVYETTPAKVKSDLDFEDYSHIDYEAVYLEVINKSEALKPLVDKIRKIPAPQYGEVPTLTFQNSEGNKYARNRLIEMYMRVALRIALSAAKQYGLDLEDAISAGFVGLIKAVDKYDPNGFNTLVSYVSLGIQHNILRECTPSWVDFYFPAHYLSKMLNVYQRYLFYMGYYPEIEMNDVQVLTQISQELQIGLDDVKECLYKSLQQRSGKISLEELKERESLLSDGDFDGLVYSDDYIFDIVLFNQLHSDILDFLESLTPKQTSVLKMRYGLGYDEPMTLQEVGDIMNVTRERIRQIERQALQRCLHLRPSISKKLKDYFYEYRVKPRGVSKKPKK